MVICLHGCVWSFPRLRRGHHLVADSYPCALKIKVCGSWWCDGGPSAKQAQMH
eukprot:UN3678